MKRLVSLVGVFLIVAAVTAGCSKSTDSSGSTATSDASATSAATGPITDSASTGLKPATTTVAMGDAVHGKAIFTQNCSSCHGADGTQGGVGPSLKGEKGRKDLSATVAWIKNPQPPMPKLYPSPLTEKDVTDVASYVQTL